MSFVITGLEPEGFRHLYGQSDADLKQHGAIRMRADGASGFPCRITLEDVEPGGDVLLVNYEHQPVASPYRSSHAIFVREGAMQAARHVDAVPEQLRTRLLSVRAFDDAGMMTTADVFEGTTLASRIEEMFADPAVAYLHVHNARPGCFAARVDRG